MEITFRHIDTSYASFLPCILCGENVLEGEYHGRFAGGRPERPLPLGPVVALLANEPSAGPADWRIRGFVCPRCMGASNEELELNTRMGADRLRGIADALEQLEMSGGWWDETQPPS